MTVKLSGCTYLPGESYEKSPGNFYAYRRCYTLQRLPETKHVPSNSCMTLGRKKAQISALEEAGLIASGKFIEENLNDKEIISQNFKKWCRKHLANIWTLKNNTNPSLAENTKTFSSVKLEPHDFSNNQTTLNWVGTLKRSARQRLQRSKSVLTGAKNPNLQELKASFYAYKESNHQELHTIKKGLKKMENTCKLARPEIYLFLAAIHLLEKEGIQAKEYLQKIDDSYLKSYLKIVMLRHSEHVIKTPYDKFPDYAFYDIGEKYPEDEKVVASKLFEAARVILKDKIR